ncbi:MAG: tyrosine-type recombinase/integrase, partial [Bradyrhizobium sp.]
MAVLGQTLQGICRETGPEVRFGPKADPISIPILVAHASRLCRAEEYDHADQVNAVPAPKRVPWNKGKLTGAKPPLRPKHVWSIRTKLQIEGRTRDLAMFNLAIDSKLRGCDIVAIRVEDVAAGGYTADRATVRQRKTKRPVRFELTEQTRQAVDDYLKVAGKRPDEFLFTSRRGHARSMTTRQYARLVSEWIGSVGLDPRLFGT